MFHWAVNLIVGCKNIKIVLIGPGGRHAGDFRLCTFAFISQEKISNSSWSPSTVSAARALIRLSLPVRPPTSSTSSSGHLSLFLSNDQFAPTSSTASAMPTSIPSPCSPTLKFVRSCRTPRLRYEVFVANQITIKMEMLNIPVSKKQLIQWKKRRQMILLISSIYLHNIHCHSWIQCISKIV